MKIISCDPALSVPVQALTTAEVDKVDLMQFQVLNTGDIVYEPPGPPPPLFEDPSIIKVRPMCILSCVSACVVSLFFYTYYFKTWTRHLSQSI